MCEGIYKSLVEKSVDAMCIISSGGFEYANPALEKLLGRSAREICNNGFNILGLIHPEDKVEILAMKRTWESAHEIPPQHEFRIITKSGDIRYVEANTIRLPGQKTQIKGTPKETHAQANRQQSQCPSKIEVNHGPQEKKADDGIVISSQNSAALLVILRDISKRKSTEEELSQALGRLRKVVGATIQAISLTVEARDPYTAGHQRRVADLARSIAQKINLDKDTIDGIRMAASIHDLGKISVPAEILSKPGKINESEYDLIRAHPKVGHDILKTIDSPWPIAQTVLQHHERINGSGYPQGLKDGEIILEAKILGVADVVEAMLSHRPYRSAHNIEQTLEEISDQRQVLYDGDVVDACLSVFQEKGYDFLAVPR